MIIKNKDELATSKMRRTTLEVVEAGIASVLPSAILQTAISYDKINRLLRVCGIGYPVPQGRTFIIGGGKASGLMAESLEKILGVENIADGVVSCKDNAFRTNKIQVIQGGHPVPDKNGIDAVRKMLQLKEQHSINEGDLVICLISGGGSALMPYPADGISLADKQSVTRLLLASGAEINEINTVRKHLSGIKGGRLGRFFSPATVVSLILSDVIGNDLSVIASGPTYPDTSTFSDAYNILAKYDLLSRTPSPVIEYLERGCRGLEEETPEVLPNCHNFIIGDNTLALQAMVQRAKELGCRPVILSGEQKGDTAAAARSRAAQVMSPEYRAYDMLLLGGETTVKVPDSPGTGGRNQHFAAVSLLAMKEYANEWVVASVGTDGSDYLPDVAGAIVDNNVLADLLKRGIDIQRYIDRCDSNTLLRTAGNSLIVTGNTGTNVCDIVVSLLRR